MPDWLVDHSMPDADPWPASVLDRAQAAVQRAGLEPEAVRVLLGAALVASVVHTATQLTVGRTRIQHDGNTPLAADDPQFVEVLRETSGLAVTAVAAVEHLLHGGRSGDDARSLESGVLAILRTVLDRVFETLGASATFERHGLHRLRRVAVGLWSDAELDRAGVGAGLPTR